MNPATAHGQPTTLTAPERRRAIRLAYLNGGLWGLGSGLAGSTLFTYLAIAYGATGFALSLLFAAPHIVGMLRLTTPAWLRRVGDRRRFTVGAFLLSAAVLLTLPIVSAPGVLPSPRASLAGLVACWTLYHLLEFFAVVALWSWFRDLVPSLVRGRFVGRRNGWMNAGRVVGTLAGAMMTLGWEAWLNAMGRTDLKWTALAACAAAGGCLVLAAVAPLARMPNVGASTGDSGDAATHVAWRDLWTPFADPNFRKFLFYGAWFSTANGVTAAAQRIYTASTLDIAYGEKRTLDASSRGLQALIMPWVGRQADRCGNVPVLAVSQGFVALAMLFFLIATPQAKWWIIGAYVCWIAYAGANVAQPNLMLGLCPVDEELPTGCIADRAADDDSSADRCPAYTAAWFAWTQLAYALSTLAGGALLDWLGDRRTASLVAPLGWPLDRFALVFLLGLVLKSTCVLCAARVPEPERPSPRHRISK